MYTINNLLSNEIKPECFINVSRNRQKNYAGKIYLDDKTKFEIELFNPTQSKILAVIELNGKPIGETGIVVKPGQRIFLERYLTDDASTFLFETYEVDNTKEVNEAIKLNGLINVRFYEESILNENLYLIPKNINPIYVPYIPYIPYIPNNPYKGMTVWYGGYNNTTSTVNCTSTNFTYYSSNTLNINDTKETGIISKGEKSNQELKNDNTLFSDNLLITYNFHLLPLSIKPVEIKDHIVCSQCKHKCKIKYNYCPKCGNKVK